MQFLQCSIPDMILKHVVELLQPFCQEEVTIDDVREALLQYKRPGLTVSEFAVVAKVSKKTVYRLIEAGELKAHKIGSRYRIPMLELHAYARDSEGENDGKETTGSTG